MFTAVIIPDDSESESSQTPHYIKKNKIQYAGDASIETFFLIGLLAQHASIKFSILHPKEVDAAIPYISTIEIEGDIVDFKEYLKSKFPNEPTSYQIINTSNNYIIDIIGLFGYSFQTKTIDIYEMIESVEKNNEPFLYSDEIISIGTQIHNIFFDNKEEIILSSRTKLVKEIF
ncbi:hypothetical protein EDI_349270 [Entamoeba dispar SAW760]|uniref:Uncharacterized protein n=1 Tax=Entamoeba dispar (strain ATCC PRA-260 / SAW760) TaxID=370354 RepID=B0E7I0_ENTDS|nr:uncharacterized protein EDI_349270 [Entamoeba dispar SAW760]EDR29508.1 hypothetical protein EDI_349270 [Entamoeba dispar SAW760]|eukprot:EDR29508.1 hypothetical protein EDI_349270 [Entamoeba dispar SAW760]